MESGFRILSSNGILVLVMKIYPRSGHRYCVRHIFSNTEKKGSALTSSEEAIIFPMARSEYENAYNYYSPRPRDSCPLAAEYLIGIDISHWEPYTFSDAHNQPSYDKVTSNRKQLARRFVPDFVSPASFRAACSQSGEAVHRST